MDRHKEERGETCWASKTCWCASFKTYLQYTANNNLDFNKCSQVYPGNSTKIARIMDCSKVCGVEQVVAQHMHTYGVGKGHEMLMGPTHLKSITCSKVNNSAVLAIFTKK